MKRSLLIFLFFTLGILSVRFDKIDLKAIQDEPIQVTVDGNVENPGTYQLDRYTSIQDVLDKAKPNDNADLSKLNPNILMKDKDVLTIPEQQPDSEPLISINTATKEELCKLNGIGPSTAEKIIQYRDTHGLFQQIEDLMNVKGIGEGKFDKVKDQISL